MNGVIGLLDEDGVVLLWFWLGIDGVMDGEVEGMGGEEFRGGGENMERRGDGDG